MNAYENIMFHKNLFLDIDSVPFHIKIDSISTSMLIHKTDDASPIAQCTSAYS